MSFTFVDQELNVLASQSMSFENWQRFVDALMVRNLPACYKPLRCVNERHFVDKVSRIAFIHILVESEGNPILAALELLDLGFEILDGEQLSIYQYIDRFPGLLLG